MPVSRLFIVISITTDIKIQLLNLEMQYWRTDKQKENIYYI
jgi:hypothetical protein